MKHQEFVLPKRSDRGPSSKKKLPVPSAVRAAAISVRQLPDGAWTLVHPRCAAERQDDLEEVEAMIEVAEHEIARDELRWLLDGCTDNLAAHELLGEIALAEQDFRLARGHFGYAFDIAAKAIRAAAIDGKVPSPFSFALAANQSFYAAGKGLVFCLLQLEKRDMAVAVVDFLMLCEPSDPLNVRALIDPPTTERITNEPIVFTIKLPERLSPSPPE